MKRNRVLKFVIGCVLLASAGLACANETQAVTSVSAAGDIHKIIIQSQILGEERTLLVRLPKGYGAGQSRYPVLFILDAEWFFNLVATDVEFLSECSYIDPKPAPQMIVIGLVNVDRNRDFTPTHVAQTRNMKFPTSGRAEPFRRFLVDEVLPVVDTRYRTHPYRILAGWSLGGLFTIDTLLTEAGSFSGYLAVSPSLWWDEQMVFGTLPAARKSAGRSGDKKLVVTLGTREQDTMVANSTNEFMKMLENEPISGVAATMLPVEGLGHNFSPKMAFFSGLATIFSDLNIPSGILDQGLAAIDDYFESISVSYRFTIPVPEDIYGKAGWQLFGANRKEEAGEVFRSWVIRHPRSPVAAASLGAFCRETGDLNQASALLKRAIQLEESSESPRLGFVLDLQRDLDAIVNVQHTVAGDEGQ